MSWHADAAATGENVPAPHSVHAAAAAAAAAAKLPGLQAVQPSAEVRPATVAYSPAGQAAHPSAEVEPAAGEYFPAAHALHDDAAPAEAKVPAAHAAQPMAARTPA